MAQKQKCPDGNRQGICSDWISSLTPKKGNAIAFG